METYPIHMARERIGTAEVVRQGLYYRIRCLCRLSGNIPVRIRVVGEREADLGLCVPMGTAFGLETSIPISRVGPGLPEFVAMPWHREAEQAAVISPDEPFSDIKRLKDAYLVWQGTTPGIGFRSKNSFPDQPGNGQNLKCRCK